MSRRRYQRPTPRRVGNRWEIIVREDVIGESGKLTRRQSRVTLGSVDEIATQKQAIRAAEPLLARVNTCRPRYAVSFAEIASRYVQTILPEMKPSSRAAAKSIVKRWLVPAFGEFQIHDIKAETVQAFIANAKGTVNEKTVWNIAMCFRSIWRTCIQWEYTSDTIFDRIRLRRAQEPEARFFTAEEVQSILAAAPEPHRTLYWIAAETGMRAGELCALRWQDIDATAGVAFARRSVWHGQITDTKGRRVRRFALSVTLNAHLIRLRGSSPESLVFQSRTGSPLNGDDVVRDHLQPLLRRLGLAPGGLHAFRHFCGSQMDRDGAPIAVARDRLGHSNASVTSRYTHSVSADDRAAAERLCAAISPPEAR
ncbi:MAG: tyrosine-type recombinase/integrase [Terriglobia bacterium]